MLTSDLVHVYESLSGSGHGESRSLHNSMCEVLELACVRSTFYLPGAKHDPITTF